LTEYVDEPKYTLAFKLGEIEKIQDQLASYTDRQLRLVGEMVQMGQKYRQEKGSAEGTPRGVRMNG